MRKPERHRGSTLGECAVHLTQYSRGSCARWWLCRPPSTAAEQHHADRRHEASDDHGDQRGCGHTACYQKAQRDGGAGHLQNAEGQSKDGPPSFGARGLTRRSQRSSHCRIARDIRLSEWRIVGRPRRLRNRQLKWERQRGAEVDSALKTSARRSLAGRTGRRADHPLCW